MNAARCSATVEVDRVKSLLERHWWPVRDDTVRSVEKEENLFIRVKGAVISHRRGHFWGINRGQHSPRPELTWASQAGCVQTCDVLPHLSRSATLSGYRHSRFVILAASSTCEQANLLAFKFQQRWLKTPPHEAWMTSTSLLWGWVEPHDSA